MLPLRHLRAGTLRPLLRAPGARPLARAIVTPCRVVPLATRLEFGRTRFASTDTTGAPPTEPEESAEETPGPEPVPESEIPERQHASVFISNVFPIMLGRWDFRPWLARSREEALMEDLAGITSELRGRHAFKVESWEVNRKDGGVFCHFSYLPPKVDELARIADSAIHTPEDMVPEPTSPASLFLPYLVDAARRKGGWPHWAGPWWGSWLEPAAGGRTTDEAGHHLYRGDLSPDKDTTPRLQGWQRVAGAGRVWVVRGRQWTEDLNRFPSSRLRVEFDGPDVSQEMLYRIFRPYGRLKEIVPPTPVPAGALRFATLTFSRLSPTVAANNCMHGFVTPVKTADYDSLGSEKNANSNNSSSTNSNIPTSRLRLYYERPLKVHYIRTWMGDHPRIVLPIVAFLLATLSYTFFDPIRSFFVRSRVEGVWNLNQYTIVKLINEKICAPIIELFGRHKAKRKRNIDDLGRASWRDRLEAERDVERWVSEYPSTFVVITGPPGSGKHDLVNRVIMQEKK
jgi:hypothetical protein